MYGRQKSPKSESRNPKLEHQNKFRTTDFTDYTD